MASPEDNRYLPWWEKPKPENTNEDTPFAAKEDRPAQKEEQLPQSRSLGDDTDDEIDGVIYVPKPESPSPEPTPRREVEGPSPLGPGSAKSHRSMEDGTALYTPDAWSFHSYPVPSSSLGQRKRLPAIIGASELMMLQERLPFLHLDPQEDPYHWEKKRNDFVFTARGMIERPDYLSDKPTSSDPDYLGNDGSEYAGGNDDPRANPNNKYTLVADALGQNDFTQNTSQQNVTPGTSQQGGRDEIDGPKQQGNNNNVKKDVSSKDSNKNNKNKNKKKKRWQEVNDEDLLSLSYV